jgi:hypothetical protein
MTHRIYQFGAVELPPAMTEDDLSTGQTESTLVPSVGPFYDAWGTARRLPRKQVINLRGMFEASDGGRFDDGPIRLRDQSFNNIVDHAGNYILVDNGQISMRRNLASLKAQQGTRQRLWRRREDDSVLTWKTARLLKVEYVREVEDAGVVARVETVFETAMATWRANDISTYSATTPAGLAISNGGQVTVNDAILTVTAVGATTNVAISGTGIDLNWAGLLAGGQTLTIDAGLQTVRVGGSDRYSGFTRGSGHTAAGWLPVPVGESVLTVVSQGGDTITLSFYEQSL